MVKILNDVYYHILFDTPMLPPETGGILGSENCVITKYFQDIESDNCRMGHYVPSIAVLNKQIKIWYEQNIIFCGIYHTHYEGDNHLSGGDMVYITKILEQFRSYTDNLLFPLVFPQTEIIFYRVKLQGNDMQIIQEDLQIINQEVYDGN